MYFFHLQEQFVTQRQKQLQQSERKLQQPSPAVARKMHTPTLPDVVAVPCV